MATETTCSLGSNRQAGITYDGMGNDLTTATYDDSGRLSTATLPNSDTLRLYYNGYGELARTRLTHLDNCNNEILLAREDFNFTPDGRALSVRTMNTVAVNVDYVWLDNLPVAQFQDSYDSTGTYIATETTYLHPDHLGTPRIGTDAARTITWRYRSDAFGIAALSGTATVRLRFPGQLNLGAEGFNYNYFRDYRPDAGRYLESDPIGLEGGINTYGYVKQNPLRFSDPKGESIVLPAMPVVARGCLANPLCASTIGAASGVALTCLINPDLCRTATVLACEDASNALDDLLGPYLSQDKKLSPGEINKLKGKGIDPEVLKGGKATGKLDLFKDRKGNIKVKPKDGSGPGEDTGININDL